MTHNERLLKAEAIKDEGEILLRRKHVLQADIKIQDNIIAECERRMAEAKQTKAKHERRLAFVERQLVGWRAEYKELANGKGET